MLWTFVAAILALTLTLLECTAVPACGASLVLAIFVLLDATRPQDRRYRGSLAFSYFALAIAWGLVVAFFLPASEPLRPPPVATSSEEVVNLDDPLVEGLLKGVFQLAAYILAFVLFTLASSLLAIFDHLRGARAKWLLILNLPGLLFSGWYIYIVWIR